jgi:hypothetical protein
LTICHRIRHRPHHFPPARPKWSIESTSSALASVFGRR